jgi:amino acid transporter
VAITAVSAVPWSELASSRSPLTDVVRVTAAYVPGRLFTVIALFSVTNTILIGYVTVSRLVYGMAHQKLLPPFLGRVHHTRRTPYMAVLTLLACFTPFAIYGRVEQLASASVLLFLSVFAIMNVSLVILHRRAGEAKGAFEVHSVFPAMGAIVCVVLVITRAINGEWTAPALAAGMVGIIGIVYELTKIRRAK